MKGGLRITCLVKNGGTHCTLRQMPQQTYWETNSSAPLSIPTLTARRMDPRNHHNLPLHNATTLISINLNNTLKKKKKN